MSTFADGVEGEGGISADMIERYVLGQLSANEDLQVEAAAIMDEPLRISIVALQDGLEQLLWMNAVPPPSGIKHCVLKAVQTIEDRTPLQPPIIHAGSVAADFAHWVDRPEMVRPVDAEDIFFIPFADNTFGLSALVWLVSGSPEETHSQCVEKFLILEGSCQIQFPNVLNVLSAGDVLSIPLHTPHTVRVTSATPCKILLQRIAA